MEIVEVNGVQLYKWNIGPSSYLVNPIDGARLLNWYISLADGATRDIIYWPENAPLGGDKIGEVYGGIPVLFPFCGASFANGKKGFWKTPKGELREMKMHGYALDGTFEVIMTTDFGFTAKFLPSAKCMEAYPYDYEFTVNYRFSDLSLSCELSLVNNGSEKMPWGAGLHPYFTLPWHKGATRKDYRLLHDAKKACNILADGSFAPIGVEKNSFGDVEMFNRIHTHLKTGIVKFGPKSGEEDITLKFGGGGKPDVGSCVVTWAESETAPYYCVEPWLSMPNTASSPRHFVEPKSQKSFLVEISLI